MATLQNSLFWITAESKYKILTSDSEEIGLD